MSLDVRHLTKKYGDKIVVDDFSFTMARPGVYALLGTNGAGKTTAIRMILGILAKDAGQVLWRGAPLDLSTCNVGYLAEERGLYPKYTLLDQLIYFAELRGVSKAEAKRRIRSWSDRLDLGEYLYPQKPAKKSSFSFSGSKSTLDAAPQMIQQPSRKAEQLSKGNQQKIQFMVALISEPELLVLDEPLSGLDPVNTDLFKSVINEQIEHGRYLILSSHQMSTVEEFCTDISIMHKSKTVLQGNLNGIKRSYGRVNLSLKTEEDIKPFIERSGALLIYEKEFEYRIKVSGEDQANALLATLISNNITVIRFDLREPSLHEIFVEKVGEVHDEQG